MLGTITLLLGVTLLLCDVTQAQVGLGCEGQADVVFVLDSTGLFTEQKHRDAKGFISRQVRKILFSKRIASRVPK